MIKSSNIFDFDHTIYDGDASLDFIKFAVLRDVRLWRYLPAMAWAICLYVLGLRSRKEIKQIAFAFLKSVTDAEALVERFWVKYGHNVMDWYKEMGQRNDVIVSASPDFLLRPIAKTLNVETLIATRMDSATGLIQGENCRAEEKLRRLNEEVPGLKVGKVYSDSVSDEPILMLGEGYIVRRGIRTPFAQYVPSRSSQFKSTEFLRFLVVGGINALLGVGFATVASLFINSTQGAFVVGFAVSLVPSYFLNSTITFKDYKFSLKKFFRFVVSYIPNFLIQLVIVHGVTVVFNVYPLITYIVSVAIAVPITFILLKAITFKTNGN